MTRAAPAVLKRLAEDITPRWRLKRMAAQVLSRVGFELVSCGNADTVVLSQHIARLLRHYAIDCVLDVGANHGQFRDLLRSHGYDGLIISFEPNPHLVGRLNERARNDSNWIIIGQALGSIDGDLTFNIAEYDVFSSFLKPDHSVTSFAGNVTARQEVVPVSRLDTIFESLQARRRFDRPYLKMDTQGFDLEVVRGAANTLARIPVLQTEVSVRALYASMPDFFTSIRTISDYGLDLAGLFPVAYDEHLRVVEFDCIMTNRALLESRSPLPPLDAPSS